MRRPLLRAAFVMSTVAVCPFSPRTAWREPAQTLLRRRVDGEHILHMRVAAALIRLGLAASLLSSARGDLHGFVDLGVYDDDPYNEDAAGDGEEASLDEAEQESIEATVETLTSQFTEQVKHHIEEQYKAQKLSRSKFSQSRVAVQVTALHVAAANNQYEKVEKLLSQGADPNTQSPAKMTPLHSASDQGYKDIVDLLLAHNATIDAEGPHGVTPLHLAAHRGRAGTTELLLQNGAPVDHLAGSFRYSPLYFAAEMGHTRVVAALLAANASTALRAHDGATALHAAAREGHEAVVAQLLAAGAEADALDGGGMRPLAWASAAGHNDVVDVLATAGAGPLTEEEEEAFRSEKNVRVEVKPFVDLQF